MKTTLHQSELWNKITELSRKAKRHIIAVAYVSKGASKILPLTKGDILIVDMSEHAVISGQTNPFEINNYYKKGVNLYTCQNLHAKIFLLDDKLIVGSSNLSMHSQNTLIEAGIITTERRAIHEAKKIFATLQGQPITPAYIKLCQAKYRPPKFVGHKKNKNHKRVLPKYSRLWLLNVESTEFPSKESKLLDKENKKAYKLIKQKKKYGITTLRWCGNCTFTKKAKVFDQIIQVENNWAESPSLIKHLRNYKSFDGHNYKRTGYFIETRIRPSRRKWIRIKKVLSSKDRRIFKRYAAIEIKSDILANKIRMLWMT